MKKSFQILEDNFRLNSDDYIKLLGMLQELQQYRDNADKNNSKVAVNVYLVLAIYIVGAIVSNYIARRGCG